jgi:hypothetical protein
MRVDENKIRKDNQNQSLATLLVEHFASHSVADASSSLILTKKPKMTEEDSPRNWPPLGLPAGSVRALLTMLIVAVVVTATVRHQKLDVLWTEVLLIALAHYFTSRRFVSLPPDVLKRLQTEGVIKNEKQPLFLPKHSIRLLLTGSFAGLAYYLYDEGRLFDPDSMALIGIVAAYILGHLVRGVANWFKSNDKDAQPSRLWQDGRAIIVLLSIAVASFAPLSNQPDLIPEQLHRIALALVLFYFGSR